MMRRESYSLHDAPYAVIFALLAMILAADTASFLTNARRFAERLTRRCGQPLATPILCSSLAGIGDLSRCWFVKLDGSVYLL